MPWPEHPEYPKIDRNLFDMILGYETVYRPGWALTTELVLKIKAAVGGTLSPDAAKALASFLCLADVDQTPGSTAAPTPAARPAPTAATDHQPRGPVPDLRDLGNLFRSVAVLQANPTSHGEMPVRKLLAVFTVTVVALSSPIPVSAQPATSRTDTALLITGDRITVRTGADGRRTMIVEPAAQSGPGRVLVHVGIGRKSYEIPAVALPYLGKGLDWSLFDVESILEAQQSDRLVVRTGNGGTRTFTADSARDFGAELTRRYVDDHKRGSFGNLESSMSMVTDIPDRPARPAHVMRTLTVAANGVEGEPNTGGTAVVYNVDDGNLFDINEFSNVLVDGTAKFSVPEGQYIVLGLFFDPDANGDQTALRYVVEPEVTVDGDKTVRVDAVRAASKVTWETPRPALLEDGGFLLRREPVTGPALTVDVTSGPGVPVWVSPTVKPVTTGNLQTYPYSRLSSPPGPGTPYEYQLQQAATGVIPEQRYRVEPHHLATVDANYYSELASVGARQRAGAYPFEDTNVRSSHQIVLPRRQTEYVSADPQIVWYGGLAKYTSPLFPSWFGGQYEAAHAYHAGQALREDWNRFPLHPAGEMNLLPAVQALWPVVPPATRNGDVLRLQLTPFSDNQAGHTGFGYAGESRDKITGAYRISRNGVTVASGTPSPGIVDFRTETTLDPAPGEMKLTLDASREGAMYLRSTASRTEWIWRSQHVEGAALPQPFACTLTGGDAEPDRRCAVEPLMTLQYLVGNLGLNGVVPTGPQTLDLNVGHVQLAPASPITAATVEFSLDNGTTWQHAAVAAQGNGSYRATFNATPPSFRGADVSLRVTAMDADGGQISETVTRAYKVFG